MVKFKYTVLWTDDEIDLLTPHIIFLENKGFKIIKSNSGNDAISILDNNKIDIIILDENMPGLGGIETLEIIKQKYPILPVVMLTKNEEEDIMDLAIGSKINDYLLKPINPNQVLSSLKKILQSNELVEEKSQIKYLKEFNDLSNVIHEIKTLDEWFKHYKKLIYWELEFESLKNIEMQSIIKSQYEDANKFFKTFVTMNYESWINETDNLNAILSHNLFRKKIKPLIGEKPTLLLIIDNLRFDQWKTIEHLVYPLFETHHESYYTSILPTTTQYSRNSIFSGLTPYEMSKKFPYWWINDDSIDKKNKFEYEFLKSQLKNYNITGNISYHKINDQKNGKILTDTILNHKNEILTTVIYNFVDLISHAKTDMNFMKELASNSQSFRSLTLSWFKNSYIYDLIKKVSENNFNLIITTDHGNIAVNKPIEIYGKKNATKNLRYKFGKDLNSKGKDIFEVPNPSKIGLPDLGISYKYIFATGTDFLIYPNNFNEFANLYQNSFQHGGISMEEMILPFVFLKN
tara:strand:- start:71840 stop:73393 length:1554 start_codon:yes stop_codon:yes gene_type:complete